MTLRTQCYQHQSQPHKQDKNKEKSKERGSEAALICGLRLAHLCAFCALHLRRQLLSPCHNSYRLSPQRLSPARVAPLYHKTTPPMISVQKQKDQCQKPTQKRRIRNAHKLTPHASYMRKKLNRKRQQSRQQKLKHLRYAAH